MHSFLPPSHHRDNDIEGIYVGRFILMSWENCQDVFQSSKKFSTLEEVEDILTSDDVEARRKFLFEIYPSILIDSNHYLLKEEVRHHQHLVRTSTWGLLNGLGVVERLHFTYIQAVRPPFGGFKKQFLAMHYGHALRVYIARRLLYGHMLPVIEALFKINEFTEYKKYTHQEDFLRRVSESYGEETARLLHESKSYLEKRNQSEAKKDLEQLLLNSLNIAYLTDNHNNSLNLILKRLCSDALSLKLNKKINLPFFRYALNSLISANPTGRNDKDRPWSLVNFMFRYFFTVTDYRALPSYAMQMNVSIFTLAKLILPAVFKLVRADPNVINTDKGEISLPAIRTHLTSHETLIIDPIASALVGSDLKASGGLEQFLPNIQDMWIGCTIDQLICREIFFNICPQNNTDRERLFDFVTTYSASNVTQTQAFLGILEECQPELQKLTELTLPILQGDMRLSKSALVAWLLIKQQMLSSIEKSTHSEALKHIFSCYYTHGL